LITRFFYGLTARRGGIKAGPGFCDKYRQGAQASAFHAPAVSPATMSNRPQMAKGYGDCADFVGWKWIDSVSWILSVLT
jgi:hypothetical protein